MADSTTTSTHDDAVRRLTPYLAAEYRRLYRHDGRLCERIETVGRKWHIRYTDDGSTAWVSNFTIQRA